MNRSNNPQSIFPIPKSYQSASYSKSHTFQPPIYDFFFSLPTSCTARNFAKPSLSIDDSFPLSPWHLHSTSYSDDPDVCMQKPTLLTCRKFSIHRPTTPRRLHIRASRERDRDARARCTWTNDTYRAGYDLDYSQTIANGNQYARCAVFSRSLFPPSRRRHREFPAEIAVVPSLFSAEKISLNYRARVIGNSDIVRERLHRREIRFRGGGGNRTQ